AALRQFSVFLENRVGNLSDLVRTVEAGKLRIVGLTIQDNADSAVARLIVDEYERARDLFRLSDFHVFETDVIAIELPDVPHPISDACRTLLQAELDVHYSYTLALPETPRGGLAIYVDDVDLALDVLANSRLTVVTEGDLKSRFE
ncbi:MAG: acetolactate synthase, partial [Planctomycetota bacterium]